jgi:proline dehydrogenase
MLRTFFISISRVSRIQGWITHWGVAWKAASRFVAGEKLSDALEAVRELNRKGIHATLDHLGENTTSEADARQAADDMISALEAIQANGLQSNISIKLSQLGLLLSEEICRQNLRRVLEAARGCGNFVRIDMEDSSLVESTLKTYAWARSQGYDRLGVVLQAYLYRSENDLLKLLDTNTPVRLVKGAYREPEKIAYPKKQDVDANFDHLTTLLLTHCQRIDPPQASPDGHFPPLPAIATHDTRRIYFAQGLAQRLGLPPETLEFQMLYGIRRDLQQQLVATGYPVRVYVPYGSQWYPYLMRRLGERPANLWFVLSNIFRR